MKVTIEINDTEEPRRLLYEAWQCIDNIIEEEGKDVEGTNIADPDSGKVLARAILER